MDKQSQKYYRVLYYLTWLVFHFLHPVFRVKGKEKLPPDPCIFVCNHSACTDPAYIALAVRPKIMFKIMAKKEVMDKPLIGWLFAKIGAFPVARDGSDLGAVKLAMKTLRAGQSLLIFPEGTRVKPGARSEPKGGAAVLAARCRVPVVPIYLCREKPFWRPINLVFGEPYRIEAEGGRLSAQEQEERAAEMMKKCYDLEKTI